MVTRVALRLFAAGCSFPLGVAAVAQPLYLDVTATRLPPGLAGPCMDAAAGDADGDGDLDLVLAMEFEPNVLLLNDGRGFFTYASERMPRSIHDSEDIGFADFDGDGDLDLVFVSEDDRTDELYINDGTGRFADASERLPTDDVSNALAVIDLDGDGARDILTGNVGMNRVLVNDGRGSFIDETAARWPQNGESRTQDLELADVDGDGDLDVIVGNEGQNQLFVNAQGRLVDATAARLPVRNDETREIRAADVDGDGDPDLLVANVSFGMQESPRDYLLLNDGSGRFATVDASRFPEDARSNFTVQTVDLDRDGDLDVLAPATVFSSVELEFLVLVTDTTGALLVARAPTFDTRDVDDDGDLDVVVQDGQRTATYFSEDGRFVVRDGASDWETTVRFEDIDLDGDGTADAALNDLEFADFAAGGDGPDPQAASSTRSSGVQIVDLDRDGDVDVLVLRTLLQSGAGDYLALLNDGTGRFSAAAPGTVLPVEAVGNGFDIEVADFDADGREDLFFCNRASIPRGAAAARTGGQQRLLVGRGAD